MTRRAGAQNLASGRRPREFTDAHGEPVRVGDRVRGYRVNVGHEGTVIECVTDRTLKHFKVRVDSPSGAWFPILYFHRDWTEKIQEETSR